MAKRKHSAALFEVIVSTQPLGQQRRPGVFRSIAGWLRSHPRSSSADAGSGAPPIEISIPEPACEPTPMPRSLPMPEPLAISYDSPALDDDEPRAGRDSAGGEIALRLNYATAIIALLALGTVVGAAFIAGRKMVLGPRPLVATQTSEGLRMSPPTPGVTEILPRTSVQLSDPADRATPGGGKAPRNAAAQDAPKQASANTVVHGRNRQKGVNYVLIQSYPLDQRKMAEEAVAVLTRNGIDSTIEKDIWRGWYSVVGTVGFTRISKNPALDDYTARIKQVSSAAHAKQKSFKAFSPMPILWK